MPAGTTRRHRAFGGSNRPPLAALQRRKRRAAKRSWLAICSLSDRMAGSAKGGNSPMKLKAAYELVRDAGTKWWDDRAMRMGAALAFYTALSLSPILLIVIAISGMVFGEEAARGQIYGQIRDLVGPDGAGAVEATLAN